MSFRLFFKMLFLTLALTATVYSMYLLNTGHMSDFWTSLGLEHKTQSLNWCSNRLTQLKGAANDWRVEEKNKQWQITKNTDTKIIPYLDMEKWLAQYCILDISIYRNPDLLDMHLEPFAVASFNDGSQAKIFLVGDKKIFQINEVIFTSPELEQGIAELKDLLKI